MVVVAEWIVSLLELLLLHQSFRPTSELRHGVNESTEVF